MIEGAPMTIAEALERAKADLETCLRELLLANAALVQARELLDEAIHAQQEAWEAKRIAEATYLQRLATAQNVDYADASEIRTAADLSKPFQRKKSARDD